MNIFLINILLAILWVFISGSFTVQSFILGFGIAYLVLALAEPLWSETRYAKKFWLAIGLFLVFLTELIRSGIRVAIDVVRPAYRFDPGIIYIPLDLKSDLGITVLANMITLTPGTLSLFVTDDKSQLCIHTMYIDESPAMVRSSIKDGFEQWVIDVFER